LPGKKILWKIVNAISKSISWNENAGNYTIYCTDGTIAKDGTVTSYPVYTYTYYDDGTCEITGVDLKSNTIIIIPEYINGYKVTSIGNTVFKNCTELTSVTIPDSVINIGQFTFFGCTNLKSIAIPNNVNSIGFGMFDSCTSLESVIIGDSVILIEDLMFNSCTKLESIKLPEGITGIDYAAFDSCTSLESITIPSSVTSIGDYAFDGCTNLTKIHYSGTISQWLSISRGFNWRNNTGNFTIYCSDGNIAKNTYA
jgi:hypothetical protein